MMTMMMEDSWLYHFGIERVYRLVNYPVSWTRTIAELMDETTVRTVVLWR
jgi:hypothetical protein